MPARGPTPTLLPASWATDLMPLFCSDTKWNIVSYIGKMARMLWNLRPCVHAPSPFQACSATPIVVMPRSTCLVSTRMMLWFGPSVWRVEIGTLIASAAMLAQTWP